MQTIARCLKNPLLATVAFVLANIAWVFGVSAFVGPQIGGMFSTIRTETPSRALEKLECPFALNRDGHGTVIATVANPYDKNHGYSVDFEVSAYRPEFWQEDHEDRQDDYQENLACTQEISIPPKQTAKTSCVVNRLDIETESVNVNVYAYSEHDTAGGIAWSYESSYKGFCLIQSGRTPISPAQAQALLTSVTALLVIGWVFAVWKYLGTISRITVVNLHNKEQNE